jgi:hypothetical protein
MPWRSQIQMSSRPGGARTSQPLSIPGLVLDRAISSCELNSNSRCNVKQPHHPRDKSLTKVVPPDASDASREPRKLDDSDAAGPINSGRIGLRALWTIWSVVVRVHSGAFFCPARCDHVESAISVRSTSPRNPPCSVAMSRSPDRVFRVSYRVQVAGAASLVAVPVILGAVAWLLVDVSPGLAVGVGLAFIVGLQAAVAKRWTGLRPKTVSPEDVPQIHATVERLCVTGDLAKPKIVLHASATRTAGSKG